MSKYKIKAKHTSFEILNYKLGDCDALEKYLSVWDADTYTLKPYGYMYDEDNMRLLIPRGVNIGYLEKLLDSVVGMDYTPDPYGKVSIKLKTMPKNDNQKKMISFLIGENEFLYTKKYSQMLLNAGTGTGKTYVSTAAMTFIGTPTIIITHMDRIKDQWFTTFTNMTDLDTSHICDISGATAINKLLKDGYNPKFKVYLVNHGTILAYAKKHGWSSIGDLFKKLQIGLKIYDESHLNFENIIRIDLNTNTKRTFYLTATFDRTDRGEARLFNICFKNLVRYGEEVSQDSSKHIIYLGLLYNSRPPLDVQSHMKTFKGFSGTRYADYLSTNDMFYDSIKYSIDFFQRADGRILILAAKTDLADMIRDFIKEHYSEKSVRSYHSKVSPDEKIKALEADIICSTSKSFGTGVDIPNLRVIIMTESYASKVLAQQVSGRLRRIDGYDHCFYCELIDIGFRRVFDMYRSRLPVFKSKCGKVAHVDITSKVNESKGDV